MGSNTKADLEAVVNQLTENQQKLTSRLYEAEHVIKSLNIALIGMAYTNDVDPTRIKEVNADDFLKFIEDNVHPIIRRSDELTSEIAENAKNEIAKQTKESQNESKPE